MRLKGTDIAGGASKDPPPPRYPAKPSACPTAEAAGRLDSLDKRQIFKQMVVGSLESSFLRYSKRKALLEYAARIGISEFDAMLLIAEAQFYSDRIDPATDDGAWLLKEPPQVELWSPGTKLLLAIGIAAVVDAVMIYCFVG